MEIDGFDVEACGGTHLDHTKEAGRLKILRSSKIQDGIVRLEYVAGNAESSATMAKEKIIGELAGMLNCEPGQVPGRAEELFEKWKAAVKKGKQVDTALTSTAGYSGDAIARTTEILNSQPENLARTITRFLNELNAAAQAKN